MIFLTFILPLLWTSVWAVNDWSKPCNNGECIHHSSSGTVKIWGNKGAIADITKAGGYSILDCHPTKLAQDIRLVCHDNEACSNLSGTLVRLPEDCSAGAFARVGKVWDHGISPPPVRGLSFDTDFEKLDSNTTGKIYFKLYGTNNPAANEAQRKVGNLHVARATVGANHDGDPNTFSVAGAHTVPVSQTKTISLLQKAIDCPGFKASLQAGVNTKVNAKVTVGVAAEGTISPPVVSKVGFFMGLEGDFSGQVTVKSSLSGSADSGAITVFQASVPGLDFPGILTIGPSFKVTARATAQLDVGVDVAVNIAYGAKGVKAIYPPTPGKTSTGSFGSKGSPLKLSVSPTVSATGTLEAHVIPAIILGVDALGGKAKADVFVNMDSSAKVSLKVDAKGSASATKGQGNAGSGSASGCVEVGGAITAVAGSTAKFFNLFDQSTKVNLYDNKAQIYKKCFNVEGKGAPQAAKPTVDSKNGKITVPSAKPAAPVVSTTNANGKISKPGKAKRAPPAGGFKCPSFDISSLVSAALK